jgi:UDP-N-acetylmuramate dehydrogenase
LKGPDGEGATVFHDVQLSERTTLGVGGPAKVWVEVADTASLAAALGRADDEGSPVLVLGGGSNVVVGDEGFPGTVVHMGLASLEVELDDGVAVVSAGAGREWSDLVSYCISEGLSGLECLIGIPGLVGGTPVQNVGAYGQEVSGVVDAVTVWDRREGRSRRLKSADCGFAYRTSVFKRNERYVVTEVSFRLQRSQLSQPLRYAELAQRLGCHVGQRPPLGETAEAVMALRRSKGMVLDSADPDTRSAGSFFTNPVLDDVQIARLLEVAPGAPNFPGPGGTKVPAGWLVENAGFYRGYQRGAARISTKHALALTAQVGARTADVLALAGEVRARVMDRFGVVLEPEPVLVGVSL